MMTTPPDMAMAPPKKSGCDVEAGEAPASSSGAALWVALAAVAIAVYLARRAGTRG